MTLCLSVDLDPLAAYEAIHGLAASRVDGYPVVRMGLERFGDLARAFGIPVTWFVVGRTTQDRAVASLLKEALRAGHELANHTWSHPYDFLALPEETRREEIRRCAAALASLSGSPPQGFRAPGYGAHGGLVQDLIRLGYSYDSSLLPSPPYYLAKAALMASMRLRGRPSRAHLHQPSTVLGPTRPYRPDPRAPWRRGRAGIWELPISCLPGRIPFIGTTLTLLQARLGLRAVTRVARLVARQSLVNLECHALDLVDPADHPALEPLQAHQPDLRIPWRTKRLALAAALGALLEDHAPATLAGWTTRADPT